MVKRYDYIIASDVRFPGGTSSSVATELAALARAKAKVGLLRLRAPILRAAHGVQATIEQTQRAYSIPWIEPGKVSACKVLIVHNPLSLDQKPLSASLGGAAVRAEKVIIVAQQGPCDARGQAYYNWRKVHQNAVLSFGSEVVWAPISPLVRQQLTDEAPEIPLTSEDWVQLFDFDQLIVERTKRLPQLTIGRHSRPTLEKWPADRTTLLQCYPEDPSIKVRMLGADAALRKFLAPVPKNWELFDFGAMAPRDFLATIDFFVYFHHPDWVEAFGRTVIEAIAAGAIAVLPPYLRATFGEAALYCAPAQVKATLQALWRDETKMQRLRTQALRWAQARFGESQYLARLKQLSESPSLDASRPLSELKVSPSLPANASALPRHVAAAAIFRLELLQRQITQLANHQNGEVRPTAPAVGATIVDGSRFAVRRRWRKEVLTKVPQTNGVSWPRHVTSLRALRPIPGYACLSLYFKPLSVIGFMLLEMEPEEMEQVVDKIEQSQIAQQNFIPLFITDRPNLDSYRRRGYAVEYVTPEYLLPPLSQSHDDYLAQRLEEIKLMWGISEIRLISPVLEENRSTPAVRQARKRTQRPARKG